MQTQQQQASNEVLHIPQVAFDWYDEYAHGDIDRRTFLARLGTLGIAGLTLGAMTAALTPNYALAHQVDFTDPDIKGVSTSSNCSNFLPCINWRITSIIICYH